MRKIIFAVLILVCTPALSQSEWTAQKPVAQQQAEQEKAQRQAERAERKAQKAVRKARKADMKDLKEAKTAPKAPAPKANSRKASGDDARYLKDGSVPTDAEGKVVFTLDIAPRGFSAQEIYDKMRTFLDGIAHDDHQNNRIGIALLNENEHQIVARYNEWLVFTSNFIMTDKAEMTYIVMATCNDESLHLTIERISYAYETDRDSGFQLPAHEVITDKRAVNKKHTRLLANYGKFRRKTIDCVDEVFEQVRNLFNR